MKKTTTLVGCLPFLVANGLIATSAWTSPSVYTGSSLSSSQNDNITVNAGTTFKVGAGNNPQQIGTGVDLNGGTLLLSNGKNGAPDKTTSQIFGTLTLTANSTIDFTSISGNTTLTFLGLINTGNYKLYIINYNPNNASEVLQFVFIPTKLNNISFYSGNSTSSGFLGTGEAIGNKIVPLPEPSVFITGAILLLTLIGVNRYARKI